MAASEDSSSFFPVFILSIMALPLVPYTIFTCFHTVTSRKRTIHCQCSICSASPKYTKSVFKKISNFSTCSNLILLLLWAIVVILVLHIKQTSYEVQMFEPFSILGLEFDASDSEIKKAYRKLSILYHPDKNPDPEAQKYFVDAISKAYQALTDPTSRENYEKYGHPDGRQGFRMGIALPQILMKFDGTSGGILLLAIVGIGILLPLIIAVFYLSRSSMYSENYIMYQTLSIYFHLMKPSLAPSKVLDVFIKAAEFGKLPVRKSDNEHLQRLFTAVRSELNLGPKKNRTREAEFWKEHPALVKVTLLIQAQLTRKSAAVSSPLWSDFNCVLELAPRLLEVLVKIALLPRSPWGRGYLKPAIGVIELSQSIFQALPLSARKEGDNSGGIAPFLQLPHFSETMVKRLTPEKASTFHELRDMTVTDRFELLTQTAKLSETETRDVELVLGMMPRLTIDISCQTDGEEGIQEGDIVTMCAWVTLRRGNNYSKGVLPHTPYFPFHKEESFWLLLADEVSNEVWITGKVSFMDEYSAVRSASREIRQREEGLGASVEEVDAAVKSAVEKVRSGSRLVIAWFVAPREGMYNLTAHCLCDAWIGCDEKVSLTIEVTHKCSGGTRGHEVHDMQHARDAEIVEEDDEEEECDDDYDSEYSEDDDEDDRKKRKDR